MGLAGRKVKQRICADPRNLSWADDAAKFGQQYLAKLGWDPSRGLGTSGDGRTSHIKVAQKLNLLGIGAGSAKMGDDTVAWKQNRDYEMLLKRLNEEAEQGKKEEEGMDEKEDEGEEKKKKRKRKDDAMVDADDGKDRKKRRKEKKDKKEKKEKKKKSKDKGKGKEAEGTEEELNVDEDANSSNPATEFASPAVQAPTPRPMAHRARFLRSKQLASRYSTAVAEILGISSSSNSPGPSSLSGTSSPFPIIFEGGETGILVPVPETNPDLRTSSTSVGDYFKEKLAARALANASDRSKSTTPLPSQTVFSASASSSISRLNPTPAPAPVPARAEVAKNDSRSEDDGETPRAGLGSKAGRIAAAKTHDDGESPRVGLGVKFGSLMGGVSSSKPAENSVRDPPKNEESPLPNCPESARIDEQTSENGKKKKRRRGEDGKEEKKKRKAKKEAFGEMGDNATDAKPVVEEKTRTESGCKKNKETPQVNVERRERKKRRKDKKEKRQEEGSQ